MSFIRTGLREMGLKIRRQRTRIALRHQKRVLQKSEISLGREGCSQASNFPEVRNEIVALKKLEQEQKEVAVRIAQIEEGLKQIEAQRQQNANEQTEALAKMEEEKKPIAQRRDQAKAAADLCARELAGVERRVQDNDTADRELLRKLAELQAKVPPPADLDAQSSTLSGQRAKLPEKRGELVRARMGSAEACRNTREKLDKHDAELSAIEKNISRVRGEFEARDRGLNETSRAQQEAIREARSQHQTVEERKNPAYLNIGRHLATHGIAPPDSPHLLAEVHKHREAVDRHSQHRAELGVLSGQIDKQELRKFYFAVLSVLVLLAIVLPLVFQSPAKREWLPQETENILSLNVEQFERDDLPKKWRKDQAEAWQKTWNALVGAAKDTPIANPLRGVVRVTRAMSASASATREFVLVDTRADVSPVVEKVEKDPAFARRSISGLPLWVGPEFALARVGPKTLAIGTAPEVQELARVRLGIATDLKISGQFFDRFQALDRESALRMISREPANLSRVFQPIFTDELLGSTELLGLALTLQTPVRARLLMKAKTADAAAALVQGLRSEPQRWLRLQNSDSLLYARPPEIASENADIELRFDMAEEVARLVLQRIGKTDIPVATASN